MHGLHDPANTRITADSLVLWINQDDLEILVGRILIDPIRVQDSQIRTATPNTFLSSGLERALILELVNPLVRRLAF